MNVYLLLILLLISPYIWLYASTFCHELGHFLCAKLVGMVPYRMQVGEGLILSRKWLFDAQIELGIVPGVGLTHAYYPKSDWSAFGTLKLKFIVYILGGALANVILFVLAIALYVNSGFSIFLFFSFFEMGFIISAIIPRDIRVYGMKLPNDGKQFILTLRRNFQQHFSDISAEHQKIIARYTADGVAPRSLFNNDIRRLQVLVMAQIELASHRFDKVISLVNQLLSHENTTASEKAYLLDMLASMVIYHRQKQYLALADGWSKEALKLASYSKTLQGTRGGVLVELGHYEEGKQQLLPLTEPENDPIDNATSSYYLAKIEHHSGNNEQARKWLRQAEEACKQVPGLQEMIISLKQELQESR